MSDLVTVTMSRELRDKLLLENFADLELEEMLLDHQEMHDDPDILADIDFRDALRAAVPVREEASKITGDTSDGYHTFNELYKHRNALFLLVMRAARSHGYGTWVDYDPYTEGWFLAGVDSSYGQISYHLLTEYLDAAMEFVAEGYEREEYDGYTSADVLRRLEDWVWDF